MQTYSPTLPSPVKSNRRALSAVDKNVQRRTEPSVEQQQQQKKLVKRKEVPITQSSTYPPTTTPAQRSLATTTTTAAPEVHHTSTTTRHRALSQKSQSLPSLPSLDELCLGEDTSVYSASASLPPASTSSELLASSSSEFDELSLYASGSEEDFRYNGLLNSGASMDRPATPLPVVLQPPRKVQDHHRGRSLEEDSLKGLIYSTDSDTGFPPNRLSPPRESKLQALRPIVEESSDDEVDLLETRSIPDSGLLEDEEWLGVEVDCEGETDCEFGRAKSEFITTVVSPPVFIPEPVLTRKALGRGPAPSRKAPPPPSPVPAQRSLAEVSRDAILSRMLATKPITTSLLSLDEVKEPRYRVHRERFHRGRIGPGSDALRKHVLRSMYILQEEGTQIAYRSPQAVPESPSCPALGDTHNKPYLFPRCGDLKDLRLDYSSSLIDDWRHGWVDLLTVQKLAWNFDMHVRSGDWIWGDRPAVEHLGQRDWEVEWSKRWKIVEWLLEYRP